MTDISNKLRAVAARLGLDDERAAAYFGVPVTTYRKWLNGSRSPSSAALRLIDVMGVVEALCPTVHDSLLPERENVPKRPRGRPNAPKP